MGNYFAEFNVQQKCDLACELIQYLSKYHHSDAEYLKRVFNSILNILDPLFEPQTGARSKIAKI